MQDDALVTSRAPGRLEQLRLDLGMIFRNLRGRRPPPFRTKDAARFGPRRDALGARSLVVERVVRETPSAVSLWLRDPSGSSFDFEPGQFFTVLARVGGRQLRRAYSASSQPGEPLLRLTIKRVKSGRVSGELNERVHLGQVLSVLGPSGSFTAPPAARELVLVAGGSGITPIRSILGAALKRADGPRLRLIYGNQRAEEIIFSEEIAELAAAHPERLSVCQCLQEPPAGWSGLEGLLTREVLERELGVALASAPDAHVLACGPEPMLVELRAALDALSFPPQRRHEERFTQPHLRSEAQSLPRMAQPLTLRARGGETQLSVAPGQTLLEAGLAAGVELPYSCAMGGCGRCKLRLVSGTVVMEEPNCLTEAERQAGWVLGCVGRPSEPSCLEVP